MNIFRYTKPNTAKLKEYGFAESGDKYKFETSIVDGQFTMSVCVDKSGEVATKVIDTSFNEEYVLHLVEGSGGEFVGKVRAEFERVLNDIKDNCFETEIFKSEQAKEIIEYIRKTYGDELEYLWSKFPSNAVWRRKDNNKWYGALLTVAKSKLGLKGDEIIEIIDLRIDPQEVKNIVDGVRYFAGYHMNKNSWFTICLDGSVPTETIFEWIDNSFKLALKK